MCSHFSAVGLAAFFGESRLVEAQNRVTLAVGGYEEQTHSGFGNKLALDRLSLWAMPQL